MDYELTFWIVALLVAIGFLIFMLGNSKDVYVSEKTLQRLFNEK